MSCCSSGKQLSTRAWSAKRCGSSRLNIIQHRAASIQTDAARAEGGMRSDSGRAGAACAPVTRTACVAQLATCGKPACVLPPLTRSAERRKFPAAARFRACGRSGARTYRCHCWRNPPRRRTGAFGRSPGPDGARYAVRIERTATCGKPAVRPAPPARGAEARLLPAAGVIPGARDAQSIRVRLPMPAKPATPPNWHHRHVAVNRGERLLLRSPGARRAKHALSVGLALPGGPVTQTVCASGGPATCGEPACVQPSRPSR